MQEQRLLGTFGATFGDLHWELLLHLLPPPSPVAVLTAWSSSFSGLDKVVILGTHRAVYQDTSLA